MLHFDKWSGQNEKATIGAQNAIVRQMLHANKNVIIDDTNLGESHLERWKEVACQNDANFGHKHFNTDVRECIKRDENREKKVGRAVILNMAMQYNLVPELKNIVVCDIDGTVADCEHRRHFVQGEKDWKGFFSAMAEDTPRLDVYEKAMDLAVANDGELIFVTARPEDYREVTEKWLEKHGMDHLHMIMRPSKNTRPDTEVKQTILEKYLKKYNIIKVFDDRPSVIRMWQENGLEVEDVGQGEEF